MAPGEVPIAETSSLDSMLARRWSHRRPVPTGLLSLLTVVFWAVWIYLILPVVGLLLWAFGVRLFVTELGGAYAALRSTLFGYSAVSLAMVGALALWIGWNVYRYGGSSDRRTVKAAEVADPEVWEAFRLDDSLLANLRGQRRLFLDLDRDGCVVMLPAARARFAHAGHPASARRT